jgi:1-aminocyclopropane-1-carboxylate deaminase/D-cysteine desulfhydrase-like pyridoxal-dependent ACC family enzyme
MESRRVVTAISAIGATRIETLLAGLPRYRLATAPTLLQEAPRLSATLRGPRILLKRDDLTGLVFGGNKVRQMEFVVGDALRQGADVFICGGGPAQSNHARAGTAAARAAGMQPVTVVQPNGKSGAPQGNALLVRLLGSDVRVAEELRNAPHDRLAQLACRREVMEHIADEYRTRGRTPYVLLGSSIPLAVLGYVVAALELHTECRARGVRPDYVFVTSSGATQAGLELGRRLLGATWRVVGVAPTPGEARAPEWVAELASGAAGVLGMPGAVDPREITNDGAHAAPAYGTLNVAARAAIALLAETEGVLLDPVYTAKGMAGLIDWIRRGRITAGETVIFVHTGGLPALFAYRHELLR